MANEAVVTGSPGERVRFRISVLASVPELMTCEVSDTPRETVRVGTTELASVPALVAGEGVLFNTLWEKLGIVLETMPSVGSLTNETVVSGSPEKSVRVGIAELASVSNWMTHEAVVFR